MTSIITPGRHNDGNGLYLNVSKSGSQSWIFMYRFSTKRREMGLGSVSTVSLANAREKTRELRATLARGIDPLKPVNAGTDLFQDVAEKLIASLKPSWRNLKHGDQWTNTLKTHAALLWDKPVGTITTTDVLEVLNPIWSTVPETATRVRARIEGCLTPPR